MPNDKKDSKQNNNILFLKYLSVTVLAVAILLLIFVLINTGIYQKEIVYLSGSISVAIIFIICTEFSIVKIGNYIELKRIRSDFSKKTDAILEEIKQTQIQIQNIKVTTIVNTGNNNNSSDAQSSKEYSGRGNSAIEI